MADSGTAKLVPVTAPTTPVPFRSIDAAAAGDAVVEVFGVLLMLHVEPPLLLDPDPVAFMLEIGTTGVAGLVNMFTLSGLATLVVVDGLCKLERPLRQPGLESD